MILLWGVREDGPLRAVHRELRAISADVMLIDQFAVLRTHIELAGDREVSGAIEVEGVRRELADVTGFYVRPYESQRVLAAGGNADQAANLHAARVDDSLLLFAELADARVLNRPSAMASNCSKPLQARLIASHGFEVPDTLVTSDVEEAAAFRRRHGRVIYKSISGIRSRVALLDDDALRRLDGAACPLQLQAYVEGVDHRVHVVGSDVFACEIESTATDYRYVAADRAPPEIRECELPASIAELAIALTRGLGLSFSGIDLRRTPDGRWVCFEANPAPGHTFYEQHTDAPISAAIASLLISPADPAVP